MNRAVNDNSDLYLEEFVEAGAGTLFVHWEGNCNLHRPVQRTNSFGKRVGVVIDPATPASVLEELMPAIDQTLVMTVNPGFGHQHFLPLTLPKVGRVRQMLDETGPGRVPGLDGGIDAEVARQGVEAGANVLVAGTANFGDGDGVLAAMEKLRASIQ